MKNKIKCIVFSSFLALTSINTMAMGGGYMLYVNGEYLKCETPAPYEIDGVTLVPLRIVAEGLGCNVEWKRPNVIIRRGATEIILTIDEDTALVNGETISLSHPPILDYARYTEIHDSNGVHGYENPPGEKNIVMVPIRFVSQALGATVNYKDGTGKIYITLPEVDKMGLDV